MRIEIPKNIDLENPLNYILTIEVHPEQFSFSLYDSEKECFCYFYRIPKSEEKSAFSSFKDFLFENDFLRLPFQKVYLINYTSTFTYIPEALYEEKVKKAYLNFLFSDKSGKTLSEKGSDSDFVVVHSIPEDVYDFLRHSFENARIKHHTTPIISTLQNSSNEESRFMLVNKFGHEMDILCFSGKQFLLGNHFDCPTAKDAVYYPLFVWRQLKFDQLTDTLFVIDQDTKLLDSLRNYIQQVGFLDIPDEIFSESIDKQNMPLGMISLALCEF